MIMITVPSLNLPPPFHVCSVSRSRGSFLWLTADGKQEAVLASTQAALDLVEARHPGSVFMLTTMKTIVSRWSMPEDNVVMAVFDPAVFVQGERRDIRSMDGEVVPAGGARLYCHGFILGGLVDSPDIPDGHGAADGCIPFDLNLVGSFILNLPRRSTAN
jgi:hypothetical protein